MRKKEHHLIDGQRAYRVLTSKPSLYNQHELTFGAIVPSNFTAVATTLNHVTLWKDGEFTSRAYQSPRVL
jgi:hypothetical protein